MKTLVTGGARSGKSRHAESLLPAGGPATYLAPGPTRDDADWAARIAAHRAQRPAAWTTVETTDLAAGVRGASAHGPVIVDCLGTWITALVTEADLWTLPYARIWAVLEDQLAAAVAAVAETDGDVVLVTNEVGSGVVPAHASGRVFRDLLGTMNQWFGGICDEVHLVVAGRVLKL